MFWRAHEASAMLRLQQGGTAMATIASMPDNRRAERNFFSGMAVAILLVALAGFARSYYLRSFFPVPASDPGLTPLIHLHGILFTGWLLLLLAQARLVAARRIDLHRKLGMAGVALAALLVVIGTLTALQGVVRGVGPDGIDPRRFLLVPLVSVGLFAVFFVLAIRARRDAQRHKRLMLLATLAMLPPAIARLLILFGLPVPAVVVAATLFVVPLVAWDWKTRGRLHPVTLWGALVLVLSLPIRFAILQTDAWLAISNSMVGLVR
jgi:hypothetical protein